jgi:hypothetical protein
VDPFNPLDKRNLGRSVADALLGQELQMLPDPGQRGGFVGAGVYAIYYFGRNRPYPAYQRIAELNSTDEDIVPIYVGKAVPRGARRAGVGVDAPVGTVLFSRIQEHAESINLASNLDLSDFLCRFLLVDDIWIPLGESLLIQRFKPIWNVLVDGFGNHDPGRGRRNQRRSAWDTLHPGRTWAEHLQPYGQSTEEIDLRIRDFLGGGDVPALSTLEAMENEGG